jgi:hypothetical protein
MFYIYLNNTCISAKIFIFIFLFGRCDVSFLVPCRAFVDDIFWIHCYILYMLCMILACDVIISCIIYVSP